MKRTREQRLAFSNGVAAVVLARTFGYYPVLPKDFGSTQGEYYLRGIIAESFKETLERM